MYESGGWVLSQAKWEVPDANIRDGRVQRAPLLRG